jgi:hypothetical protein
LIFRVLQEIARHFANNMDSNASNTSRRATLERSLAGTFILSLYERAVKPPPG